MDGIKFLRIEEKVICILLTLCIILVGIIYVVFYVNLVNWSINLGGIIYMEIIWMMFLELGMVGNFGNVKYVWKYYLFYFYIVIWEMV